LDFVIRISSFDYPDGFLKYQITMPHLDAHIAENLNAIRARIARAAASSGRAPSDVRLVAVTKYVGPAEIEALLAAGCFDLGESRPQSLWERAAIFQRPEIRWHFIGHMQRNKVRRTLPAVYLFHSADSLRLLAAMEEAAKENDQTVSIQPSARRAVNILLEVNISGDANKHGFAPADVEPALQTISQFSHLRVKGLMGMAALEGDSAAAERNFNDLRQLRDRLLAVAPPNVELSELSMGMSGDFEQAIRAGSTLVRIGSALFE
jgi:pyridoxal phosphate enzyme (YggS family)